jgi:two-component system NtrC family sensor kinase
MTPARILRLSLSLLLAAAAVLLGGLSLHRKVQTFQPLGFVAEVQGSAAVVGAVSHPATGLTPGDQILLVAGGDVGRPAEVAQRLREQPESLLTVVRGDRVVEVIYHRPPLDIDLPYLLLALIAVGYLLIGLYTLLRQTGRPGGLFFLWCLASASFYLLTLVGPQDLLFKLVYAGDEIARLLLPALTVHLFLVFPAPVGDGRWNRRALPFLYLPAAVLLALQADLVAFGGRLLFGRPTPSSLGLLDRLELAHLVLYALAAVAILAVRTLRSMRGDHSLEQQRQLQWVLVGVAGGYVPFFVFYGLPAALGLRWPEPLTALAVVPLALVPLTFAYAILRYKLWDLAVIARDVASSTLTLLLGIIGFSLVNLAIVRGVPQDPAVARNLLSFASGLGIAGLLVPTRRSIASALERLHYGGNFAKRRALSELGRRLLGERDLGQLCTALLSSITEAVELDRANLYLAQGSGLVALRGEPGLPSRLAPDALGDAFWPSQVQRLAGLGQTGPLPTQPPAPAQRLFAAGYRYAFPLTVLGNRVGVVVTGNKDAATPLNSEDVELIRHLLDQAALAIENAQLLGQLHRRLAEVSHLQRYNEGILESSPAGIAVLDATPDRRVISANAAFAAILQDGRTGEVDRAAVVGRPLAELLPIGPLPAPGEPALAVSFCDPDGRERHLQLSIADYSGDGGDAVEEDGAGQRILVVHDVSERVAMEGALREQDRLAALGLLAAGVAHEVNTPITGISSYAQMLLADTPEGDPHREILQKMERQTFRAARIVNNLLGYARNRSTERRPVALPALLAETVELLADRIRKRRIEVVWQLPAAGEGDEGRDEAVVLACDGELQQVLTNLVLNAVDAMAPNGQNGQDGQDGQNQISRSGPGGRLTLGIEVDGGRVRVRVADTGPGIPPERRDKIFQPFFSTKLASGGTGLGLAISHDIVDRHGGTLAVESEPGAGACFILELPRLDRPRVSA